ncbi:hypothetical protein Tco_1444266, partial [Tanacetum coccineum]
TKLTLRNPTLLLSKEFLGISKELQILASGKLVCWSAKKQSSVAMSSAEAEYVAAAGCCVKSSGSRVSWLTMMFSMTRCAEGIIAFNNVVALFEHPNELYRPMLSFLSNCCINKALTLQPSAMHVEYLKEFWYTTEVEEETKTITFSLSWCDKPMSFTQDEFISTISLPMCKDDVPLPPKETIDIGAIIFSDLIHKLQNGKKNRETNICYTRFLSLIFEKLLGENYISNDLTLVKPHTITTASFQKPLASEVPLTSHMLKVAKLSEEPEQSLIPPFGEVNADDTTDKSLSRASVQPITYSKAPTDLKIKKKKNAPSSFFQRNKLLRLSTLRSQWPLLTPPSV